jgi:hypothetical protein
MACSHVPRVDVYAALRRFAKYQTEPKGLNGIGFPAFQPVIIFGKAGVVGIIRSSLAGQLEEGTIGNRGLN